jgi:RNA polymerase sigma-70 factor (ECF subfamily)
MVASPEEAEDLVQSTILSALKGRKSFDGRFLRSWLVKILRNETLAYQKKKRIHVSFEELPDDVMTAYPFWSTLSAQLDANAIQDEIAKLPEHMSYEEAADIMEVPLGTVRSRLFRARVEIRRRLGESDEV